jgi:hypothetical protein
MTLLENSDHLRMRWMSGTKQSGPSCTLSEFVDSLKPSDRSFRKSEKKEKQNRKEKRREVTIQQKDK